ncbi:hypothetical protein P691DRAFT_802468 [Macrolepiota fuliginosa MF-IS2]|uniref:DUF7704 domain-containing protein n=1 Tax=Macrolepiota fuliginosa MF-IS2 TaxID=1400762 RepID=A0A9P5XLM2_9AGAR|nr:hypothetical protein P691DRAFT_802468 [Macrolepiota fuliginosa MF-IS2]
MPPSSAIPDFYYFWFAAYEPFLTITGFLGTCVDPVTTHNTQAPWPIGTTAPSDLPPATIVTTIQLAHVCGLVGLMNCFVLTAVRKHLHTNLALQEKIVRALFTPLVVGDVLHLALTFWALGDQKFDFANWSPMLWTTHLLGLTLMLPRIAWHLGVGRYVDARDGPAGAFPSPNGSNNAEQIIKS